MSGNRHLVKTAENYSCQHRQLRCGRLNRPSIDSGVLAARVDRHFSELATANVHRVVCEITGWAGVDRILPVGVGHHEIK